MRVPARRPPGGGRRGKRESPDGVARGPRPPLYSALKALTLSAISVYRNRNRRPFPRPTYGSSPCISAHNPLTLSSNTRIQRMYTAHHPQPSGPQQTPQQRPMAALCSAQMLLPDAVDRCCCGCCIRQDVATDCLSGNYPPPHPQYPLIHSHLRNPVYIPHNRLVYSYLQYFFHKVWYI